MSIKLLRNRLIFTSGISLLLHLLVFFLISLLLQLKTHPPKQAKSNILEVKFTQATPVQSRPNPSKQVLTASKLAPLKVAQKNSEKPAKSLVNDQIMIQPDAADEPVEGIAFPRAIATPFSGQTRTKNPFSPPTRGGQQHAAQAYNKQREESQARQRTEQHAQLLVMQLNQILSKRLQSNPDATGQCTLIDSATTSTKLTCNSPALYQALSQDETTVVGILSVLSHMGQISYGFSATRRNENLSITLINEITDTDDTFQMPVPP